VPLTVEEPAGSGSGRQHPVRAQRGQVTVSYDATITAGVPTAAVPAGNHAGGVEALRPSRYCPSDRLTGFAHSHFDLPSATHRVRAICECVWRHVS
jgi:hypothetical protein